VAAPGESGFVQRVGEIASDVAAVASLLEHVAGLLRQVFHVMGWLVLLWAAAMLPFQAHPSPVHLMAPGAGVLAVLQGMVPAWLRRHVRAATALAGDELVPGAGELGVVGDVPDPDSGGVACGGFTGSEERVTQA
jgi:hypothetical protein